jgi:chromosome segregation ATPase
MGKTLVIVSIALSAIAGVLGFLNRQTLSTTKADLATVQQERDRTAQTLSQVQGELGTSKKSVEELTTKNQASESENAKLKADLAGKKSELEKLVSSVAEKESEVAQLKTEIESKTQEIAALQTASAAPAETDAVDETTRITELETVNAELASKLDSARGELEVFKQKEKEKLTRQALNSLTGRILAVNQAWNFVVLNIGDRNGILSNTELIVKRGTARIGRVRITSVEPSTSIADIIPGSMVRGLTIQPGDDVIYQVETN